MRLLDYLNEKTNNAYKDFKLVSVIFDKKIKECVFKFLYKDNCTVEDKDRLKTLISEYLKNNVNVVIKCKKAYADVDLVKDVLYNFLTKHYASVCVDFDKNNITATINGDIAINILCNKFQYRYLSSIEIKKEILDYVENFFFDPVNIDFEYDDILEDLVEETIIPNNLFISSEDSDIKYTKIKDICKFIGEDVNNAAITISSVTKMMDKLCEKEKNSNPKSIGNIEMAGNIRFLTQKSFTSKRKDKNGNGIEKVYFSFTIFDKTGRMNCVYFPLKSDELKAIKLKDDDCIIAHGDVEEFNGRVNFKIKSISYCNLVEEEKEEEFVKIVSAPKNEYLFVKPEPYIEMQQDNLFAEKEVIGNYMQNNDIVVFDIETTGLEATLCEIIEIGAVKIRNGVIAETFETLIKPTTHIPEEITTITGITDEMVKDSPSIKQVLPDFYKFCYGTTIMAYNIDFDYKFITVQGKKLGYVFDMKQIDAMYLARAFVPGLKNFKLSSVCKKLDVSLENAHRAVHDAIATAEVVIKLNTHIDKL